MNHLTETIDNACLTGLAEELATLCPGLAVYHAPSDFNWYLVELASGPPSVWTDFHLAALDLIAEVDDETLDAIVETYCKLTLICVKERK